jgi:pyruvate ferredoxin oxidoreductase delta subunit
VTAEKRMSEIAMSEPAVGEAGATGEWRSKHPVLEASLCTAVKRDAERCQMCWGYCPDQCIARGVPPVIDLAYCKGCSICAQECPTGAITMVAEETHGTCAAE